MVANYWTWRSFFDLLAVIAYLKTFILLPFTFPLKKVWSFVTFHEIMMVQKCPPQAPALRYCLLSLGGLVLTSLQSITRI